MFSSLIAAIVLSLLLLKIERSAVAYRKVVQEYYTLSDLILMAENQKSTSQKTSYKKALFNIFVLEHATVIVDPLIIRYRRL